MPTFKSNPELLKSSKMKWGMIIGVLALTLLPLSTAQTDTCAISTGSGLLQDTDCDDIPDIDDNCPRTANPNQLDTDRDGRGDACDLSNRPTPRTQPRDTTDETTTTSIDISTVQAQDITINGAGAVYPITITNNGDQPITVELTPNLNFGTYRIDPAPTVTVRDQRDVYLHITADNVPQNQYTFTIDITADGTTRTLDLTANVLQPDQDTDILPYILWIILALMIITGGIVFYNRYKPTKATTSDEDIHSYY